MIRLTLLLWLMVTNIAHADDETVMLEQRVNELTDKLEQMEHKNDLLQKKLDSLAADIEFRLKEFEGKSKVAPTATKQDVVKAVDPKQSKVEFDNAYSLLKEQKYEEAEVSLSNFIKKYPKSEYTGNAYYWLGESFMLRKRYDKAAANYIQSFNKFPKNSKADLSMLKLVSALNILGKKKEACNELGKLKSRKDSLSPVLQKLLQKEALKINCK